MNVIILRGVSGSGKTTISKLFSDSVTVSADDYFTDKEGNYNFNPEFLGRAHDECYRKFVYQVDWNAYDTIIVANTNTSSKEFERYEEYAKSKGCKVFHLVVENRHGNESIHNVPQHVIERQTNKLKNDIIFNPYEFKSNTSKGDSNRIES